MPDILSHLLCANNTLLLLDSDISHAISKNRNIYNIGAQGPDLFFYYKIYPWQKSGHFNKYGTLLHTEKTYQYFLNAALIIKNNLPYSSDCLFSDSYSTDVYHRQLIYIAGFLTHYAFDTIAHPYIFYFSGVDSGYNHKYFECILDTLLKDYYDARNKHLQNTGKSIHLNKNNQLLIGDYLSKVIFNTYDEVVPQRDIQVALKDMSSIMKIMYDPTGFKTPLLKKVDCLSHANGKIMTAIFPAKLKNDLDYLNLNHNTWTHPCSKEIVYKSSFIDLFEQAVKRSNELIQTFILFLKDEIEEVTFSNIIGNRLYDTGLDATENQTMVYENLLFDFKETFNI